MQWRGRIGTFCMPARKLLSRIPTLRVRAAGLLRLMLALSCLLVIGGVETNPGPPTRQAKLSASGEILKDDDVKSMFEKLSEQLAMSTDSLREQMTGLKADITGIKDDIQEVNRKHGVLEETCARLQTDNAFLREKMRHLEDQSRRDNLIFWGINEDDEGINETWNDCEAKVRAALTGTLDIQEGEDDSGIQIERAHRIGRRDPVKPRGIMVKFGRWKHREVVLSTARTRLGKKSRLKVSEDYSQSVRSIRGRLLDHIDAIKEHFVDEKVTLSYDKIVAGKRVFRYDDDSDSVYSVEDGRRNYIPRIPAEK